MIFNHRWQEEEKEKSGPPIQLKPTMPEHPIRTEACGQECQGRRGLPQDRRSPHDQRRATKVHRRHLAQDQRQTRQRRQEPCRFRKAIPRPLGQRLDQIEQQSESVPRIDKIWRVERARCDRRAFQGMEDHRRVQRCRQQRQQERRWTGKAQQGRPAHQGQPAPRRQPLPHRCLRPQIRRGPGEAGGLRRGRQPQPGQDRRLRSGELMLRPTIPARNRQTSRRSSPPRESRGQRPILLTTPGLRIQTLQMSHQWRSTE